MTLEETLRKDGRLVYTNKGVSMLPLLRQDKDLMVIIPPDRAYRRYDAVLFKRDNGQYVLHRILRCEHDRFFIVGDNCTSGEWVSRDRILGRLTQVQRSGGRLIRETDPSYRLYVHLWCDFYPLRAGALRLRRWAGRICRRMRRR